MKNKLVVVAMSGGVDSSVAACLLKEQGYNVVGMTMCFSAVGGSAYGGNIPDVETKRPRCCGVEDIEDAARVCHQLGIPHYKINLSKELKEKVIKNFCREYLKGRTPNPCVLCNQFIKFGRLLEKAQSLGARYLATGHYARIFYNQRINKFQLKRPKDKIKDQTYFLYRLNQRQLSRSLLPLADYTKEEVRLLAKRFHLLTAEKLASQEICFLPDKDYHGFIRTQINTDKNIKTGPIRDKYGKILGQHKGVPFYTIGQRKGLGISYKLPLYVIKIDPKENTIVVGGKNDLLSKGLIVAKLHFISERINKKIYATLKIRYNHPAVKATLIPLNSSKMKVIFKEPQFAVTPGQSAVFYRGDTVLGGGIIERAC